MDNCVYIVMCADAANGVLVLGAYATSESAEAKAAYERSLYVNPKVWVLREPVRT